MSETPTPEVKPGKILAAMNKVQTAFSKAGIAKDRNNAQQGYKFRGIDDVYNAASTFFADYKVLIVPHYGDVQQTERVSAKGGAIFVTRLLGHFDFVSTEDGSTLVAGPFPGEAMDSADKSTNKAMSAAFKYALMQVFTIPTEGDNDADATTHEVVGQRPARQIERPAAEEPAAAPAAQASPLAGELDKLLANYGAGRKKAEAKIAEALGVKSLDDLPPAKVPTAIEKVLAHQAAAAARKKPAKQEPPSGLNGPIDDGDIPV